jgi:hypothetical protein
VKVVAANETAQAPAKPAAAADTAAKMPPSTEAANEPTNSPAPRPVAAQNRKKGSGRRGIQLKSLGKPGSDGLN